MRRDGGRTGAFHVALKKVHPQVHEGERLENRARLLGNTSNVTKSREVQQGHPTRFNCTQKRRTGSTVPLRSLPWRTQLR